MENIYINSIILVLLGALVAIIPAYLSHLYTSSRDTKNYENQQILQKRKLEFDEAVSYKNDLNKSIEEIYKISFNFDNYVSLTSSVIISSGRLTFEEFDNNYRQESEQLARMKSLIFARIPRYSDDSIKISGHHNRYWGYQRILLGIDINNDAENYRVIQGEVIKVSNEMSSGVRDLILKIQSFFEHISDAHDIQSKFIN